MSLSPGLLEQFNYNSVFVETGSGQGEGIQAALDAGFKSIHSIESDIEFFWHVHKRFFGIDSVNLLCGNSGWWLPHLLYSLPRAQRITFWLDAHFSADEKRLKPFADPCPLLDELQAILLYRMGVDTILIDDMFYFNSGYKGWHSIESTNIYAFLSRINPTYKIMFEDGARKGDILIAEP